jgi:hypothetical protein
VIDGEVVHAGGVPGPDQVRAWMQAPAPKDQRQ